jgi:hypothetical protein
LRAPRQPKLYSRKRAKFAYPSNIDSRSGANAQCRFENQFVSIQLLQIFARKLLLGRLLQQNLPLTDILTNLITNRQHHQIGVDFPSHSIISSLRAAGTTPGLLASPRHSRRLHRACRRISRMPLRCIFFATPSGGYKEALKSYGSTPQPFDPVIGDVPRWENQPERVRAGPADSRLAARSFA